MTETALSALSAAPAHRPFGVDLGLSLGSGRWRGLLGDALPLALAAAAQDHAGLLLVTTASSEEADQLLAALGFLLADAELPLLGFPDWETLPYDVFSPHQDIISRRIDTLARLPDIQRGILVLPVATLSARIAPPDYIAGHALSLDVGQQLDLDAMRARLERYGYRCVPQVMEHGDFAVRGSILDLFPMGSKVPLRLDLFDEEIDSIRSFDPETQRSLDRLEQVRLLPAREHPLDEAAIARFRQAYRERFPGDPKASLVYRDVSQGLAPAGIEYYLPLFFERPASLFDYLPAATAVVQCAGSAEAAATFAEQVAERYEQRAHDRERPALPPANLFLSPADLDARIQAFPGARVDSLNTPSAEHAEQAACAALPDISIRARAGAPLAAFDGFIKDWRGRVLFCAESTGRREAYAEFLHERGLRPAVVETWADWLGSDQQYSLITAPFEQGLLLGEGEAGLAIVPEARLWGERARQARRRKRPMRDPQSIIGDLTDLAVGAPVVHEEHGVGRYLGLTKLDIGGAGAGNEFLTLEYARGDKLYVPVSSLHLIHRYTGASPEGAPLHKLGSEQWAKARRRAAEQVRDVAAELLEIHARRAARQGQVYDIDTEEYRRFAEAFPFEETADQQQAIDAVLADLASPQPMDRVVCGDVGFGKTEVAMRAAFVVANGGKQVVVLVPTTLLAQQHYDNFRDRMADWPLRIESLSRFKSAKEQTAIIQGLNDGRIDILIATHRALSAKVKYKDLGLVIVDEEHRFGVRHKEQMKSLRAEVDILTLTATPIPRTLNMALSGLRDLSIIATPPAARLAIQTFVCQWDKALIREACLRELKRGGQVYFVHNKVETIERVAKELEELVPEARIAIGHGQMRESELEQVMLDFYHRRANLLVCTTIVESGIDVPTANTILIDRADHLGLAQLHQLRGRVGRSHHRAYAYLIAPPPKAMTADAVKRLEALAAMGDLGSGFTLATHDLEIRGAGELLGEGQSGQMQEIGFSMYTELLERAVDAIKAGRVPELDRPLDHGAEVDLHIPALIPDDYLPDIHTRLILYKRIANAADTEALRDLQVEMIDRFGLLPDPVKNLFATTEIKLAALPLGLKKIDVGASQGRIEFGPQANIDPGKLIGLIQGDPARYRLKGQEALSFEAPMEEPASRMLAIRELIEAIRPAA